MDQRFVGDQHRRLQLPVPVRRPAVKIARRPTVDPWADVPKFARRGPNIVVQCVVVRSAVTSWGITDFAGVQSTVACGQSPPSGGIQNSGNRYRVSGRRNVELADRGRRRS